MTQAKWPDRLARRIGVERHEIALAGLLFGALFLLIALQTTIKVVRDATFLSRFGIAELSYVMLGMALVTGAALKLYNRATAGHCRNRVIWTLNLTVATSLVGFAIALRYGGARVPVFFYLWTAVASLAVLSEFWLLLNDLFHARQARRLFTIVAAGGVLGGVFGGATSQILSRRIPVSYMLLIAAGELAIAALLCELAWRRMGVPTVVEPAEAQPVRTLMEIVRGSSYARWIVAVAVCMTVATSVGDWQFKAYAKLHFASHEADMARFFSILAVVLGGLSFLLQLIGTRRLLRLVGANGCMRALPVATGLGAAFVLSTLMIPVGPLVAAAAGSMLVDGVKFSVDRSATELLFAPLTEDTRAVFKRFVDTALDRFSGGLAALVWLGLLYTIGVNRPERLVYASAATLVVVAIWLIAVQRLQSAYVDAYREFIGAPAVGSQPATSPRQRRRVERLLAHLGNDAADRHRALRGLTALQSSSPVLGIDPALVIPRLGLELEELEQLVLVEASIADWPPPRLKTLHRMIRERMGRGLERIIRLLAMLYPPSDIMSLHRALRSSEPRQRSAAVEFLDALVDIPDRQRLIRVVERATLASRKLDPVAKEEGLKRLFSINDARLRAGAVWSAVASNVLLEEARHLSRSDPSRRVRAAAKIMLSTRRARPSVPPSPPCVTGEDRHAR